VTKGAVTGLHERMARTDDEIVQLVRSGDAEAYATLLDRHYPKCLRYGMRLLGNRQDAEEVVQDAFVRAYRYLPKYETRNRFEAWLFQILVNACRTRLKQQQLMAARFSSYDEHPDGEWGAEDAEPARQFELTQALNLLSEDDREALLLKYLDDRTYENMSEITGAGVSALKMRVKRARERLRSLLEGVYDA
jgi:RNA polymerase sigma-70 factor (ECF subfamily)